MTVFDPLLPAPAVARFQFMLQAFHLAHLIGGGGLAQPVGGFVVFRQQSA
jgi:hypothetical protein